MHSILVMILWLLSSHTRVIVTSGEEGQDAGGLLREWYLIMSREIFNPNYALFMISPGDRVTYTINPSSHCNSNHLSYFKFVGRFLAKVCVVWRGLGFIYRKTRNPISAVDLQF